MAQVSRGIRARALRASSQGCGYIPDSFRAIAYIPRPWPLSGFSHWPRSILAKQFATESRTDWPRIK